MQRAGLPGWLREADAPRVAYDGIVSRYLNRRISRPIAIVIAPLPITPNMVTVFTLGLAAATGAMAAAGWNIIAGVLIQAVSIVDGVDGDLARRKGMATRFGEVLDAVTDRYADAFIISGMTVYAVRFEDWAHAEFVGALALAATLTVSYSRARIEASLTAAPSDGLFGIASRDVRSLIAAVGLIAGQAYWTLAVLAVLSGATIAWRLLYLRISNGRGSFPSRP